MAKSYEFSISAVKASFDGGLVQIELSQLVSGKELYKAPFVGSLAAAIAERDKQMKLLNLDSAWFINMKERNARKAPGLSALRQVYWDVKAEAKQVAA